ncbi:MAG: hypothetical protein CVU38_09575 [Chloroflexi bacterium HGW-Chloroflexi-1]|nr:MAG: hypothetical protein CVU38_09575 [Chloroflexi bacterium HGW-Chloroflexi-1]
MVFAVRSEAIPYSKQEIALLRASQPQTTLLAMTGKCNIVELLSRRVIASVFVKQSRIAATGIAAIFWH